MQTHYPKRQLFYRHVFHDIVLNIGNNEIYVDSSHITTEIIKKETL